MATNKRKDAAALFELLDKSTLKVPKNPNGSLKIPSWWSSKTNPVSDVAKITARFNPNPTPTGAPTPAVPTATPGQRAMPTSVPAGTPGMPQPSAIAPTPASPTSSKSNSNAGSAPSNGAAATAETIPVRPWTSPRPQPMDPGRTPIGASPVGMIPRAGFSSVQTAPAPGASSAGTSAAVSAPAGPMGPLPTPDDDADDAAPIAHHPHGHRLIPGVPAWAWAIGASCVLIVVIGSAYLIMHRHHDTTATEDNNPSYPVQNPNDVHSGGVVTPGLQPLAGNNNPDNGAANNNAGGNADNGGSPAPNSGAVQPAPTVGQVIPAATVVWTAHRYFLVVATFNRLDIANRGATFLAGHGVNCTIVKDKRGNYLLIATDGVDRQADPAAQALREKVVEIGREHPDAKKRHNGRGVWDDAYFYNVSRTAG
jgi:hypothetical protein